MAFAGLCKGFFEGDRFGQGASVLAWKELAFEWVPGVISRKLQANRCDVRLADGEGKRVRPANLTALAKLDDHAAEAAEAAAGQPGAAAEAASSRGGRVLAFWGDARWSRTQLLGEIARGSWGMCQGTVLDLASVPRLRRSGLDPANVAGPSRSCPPYSSPCLPGLDPAGRS